VIVGTGRHDATGDTSHPDAVSPTTACHRLRDAGRAELTLPTEVAQVPVKVAGAAG
jgi:hypothetical protein